ncbi:LysM peptidoglycan-binding domain-containing protein [Leisingera thetidis]|uniref:LysM peptidoglycan-binding domain-containing protein n=1 Tax=Leisingera thetidis TaxID=2930199 RepID=UPI0021F7005F|nr:LysM domain-containing protein [Leisingera thetidis]
MWIQHKVKEGETLEDIAKKYKVKDLKVLLQHPKNKPAAAAYRKKQPLKKGMVVHTPDPKAKCYVMKVGNKQYPLSEKEWKQSTAALNRAMDLSLKRMKRELDSAKYRHKMQNDLDDEHFIISFLIRSGDGPVALQAMANGAVANLEKTVKRRDYKHFEFSMKLAEKQINMYRTGLGNWLSDVVGTAEGWKTGLSLVRDINFVIFGAAAMTLAAPATAVATVAWGTGIGAGTAVVAESANQIGKVIAGDPVTNKSSAKAIGKAMLRGGIAGGAGATIARFISGYVAPKLAEYILRNRVAARLATRLISKSPLIPKLTDRLLEQEIKALGENVVKRFSSQAYKELASKVLVKLFVRSGVSGTSKILQKILLSDSSRRPVHVYLEQNATTLKGKMDQKKLGERIAKLLQRDPVTDMAFETFCRSNVKKIEGELRAEVRKGLKAKTWE